MKKRKGQVLLELFWVTLFLIAMASSLTWFYEKAQGTIEKHRIGKIGYDERFFITIR